MNDELKQIAHELRTRYSSNHQVPNPDLIAQHANDVAHMLLKWADRIDKINK